MKNVFVCILMFISMISYSQTNMVKGSQYLGVKYGFSKYSFPKFGQLEYGWMFKEKLVLRTSLNYENGKVGTTNFSIPSMGVGINYNMFNIKNKVGFNLGADILGGWEFISSSRNDVFKENKILPIGRLGIEVDFVLTEKFSLRGEFMEWYSHYSYIGKWYYTGTIGLVYILN